MTIGGDAHGPAVDWGLRQLGHEAVFWDWERFPKEHLATLRLAQGSAPLVTLSAAGYPVNGPFDVIWKRRLGTPAPMPQCHPDDATIVIEEAERFVDAVLPFLGGPQTRWVNHPDGDHRAKNKVGQLMAAQAAGFLVPDTLIGNDIAAVRDFFMRHQGRMINKAFAPAVWDNGDGTRTNARTAAVRAAHLQSEYAVRATPGIFQEMVDKQCELRVTVMGDITLAAAIDSQRDGPTVDWRYEGGRGHTNLRAFDLDPQLAARCVALCKSLGIVFGCIDLIVRPDGAIVFLEVNEGGQFLFVENAAPSLPMLDTFCRFLIGDAPVVERAPLSMEEYHRSDIHLAFRQAERAARVERGEIAA